MIEELQKEELQLFRFWRNVLIGCGLAILALVIAGMAGCPMYKVYTQGKEGEAELKRAEQNRQIVVQSAEAEKEAATLIAEAGVILAEGTAKELRAIKEELKDMTKDEAETFILYKWVKGLNDESSQVIYVATEANLPILLEAGRIANSEGPSQKVLKIEAELGRNMAEEGRESSEQIRE